MGLRYGCQIICGITHSGGLMSCPVIQIWEHYKNTLSCRYASGTYFHAQWHWVLLRKCTSNYMQNYQDRYSVTYCPKVKLLGYLRSLKKECIYLQVSMRILVAVFWKHDNLHITNVCNTMLSKLLGASLKNNPKIKSMQYLCF